MRAHIVITADMADQPIQRPFHLRTSLPLTAARGVAVIRQLGRTGRRHSPGGIKALRIPFESEGWYVKVKTGSHPVSSSPFEVVNVDVVKSELRM